MLFAAVNSQDIRAIKGLFLKGGNVNVQSKTNEYTPLIYAIENDKFYFLSYLILGDDNLYIVTSNKIYAYVLNLVATISNLKALRMVLNPDIDIFIKNKCGNLFCYMGQNYKNILISAILDTKKDSSAALINFCVLESLEEVNFHLKIRQILMHKIIMDRYIIIDDWLFVYEVLE